jgi:hypothetical protein
MQVKMLELVLEDQRADKAYDLPRIAVLAKTLEEEAAQYTDAKMTLMLLESALSADSFSVATQLAAADFGSFKPSFSSSHRADVAPAAPPSSGSSAAEWDPDTWGEIEKRISEWVVSAFKAAPDLEKKIKISSDRVLHFQLVGRKVCVCVWGLKLLVYEALS